MGLPPLDQSSYVVVIQVLSGKKQGSVLRPAQAEFFVVGTSVQDIHIWDKAPVSYDGLNLVKFRRATNGWTVEPGQRALGPVLLNDVPLNGREIVRGGDLLRLSIHGPDFLVELERNECVAVVIEEPPAAVSPPTSAWSRLAGLLARPWRR